MSILAWLGLTPPPDNVTVATQTWLAADRDARAEVSAREQLAAAQCREAAARYELRERNRMYGRASATIGAQRNLIARMRGDLTALSGPCRDTARARTGVGLECVLGGGHQLPHRDVNGLMWGAPHIALPSSPIGVVMTVNGIPLDQAARRIERLVGLNEQRAADEALVEAMQRHPSGEQRACTNCGDRVHTLSARDWCDCCETFGYRACPRCNHDVAAFPPHTICDECETEVVVRPADADAALVATAERLGDEIGPGRTAAVEGAAITLRAHTHKVLDSWGSDRCSCGWTGADHPHHVAEQLAAVGALGTFAAAPTPPGLIDGGGNRWHWFPAGYSFAVERPHSRQEVDLKWGPIRDIEPEEVPS